MHPLGKRAAIAAPVALAATLLAACGGGASTSASGADDGQPRQGGVFRTGINEPVAIDPSLASEGEGQLVTRNIFTGLVALDADAKLIPGAAEKWSANADCTQWTFDLKPNTHFSDGETVTATSFIDGMNRTAAKDTASDIAYYLDGIKGYDAVHSGTATTMTGLSAPDPDTLVMSLDAPDCERDKKTIHNAYYPVPPDAATDKGYADLPIGNGPFELDGPWQHDKQITLVRNDGYDAGPKAHLDRVELVIDNSIDTEYKNFQAGDYDYSRISTALQEQAKATYGPRGDFLMESTEGINYLIANNVNPPLNNADARKAISYAIDRDAIIKGVLSDMQVKATSLTPPEFTDAYQPGVCQSCVKQDPAKARQLAARGGLTPGTQVNLYFASGGGHEAWIAAVAQELTDVLGLKVNVQPLPNQQMGKAATSPDASGLFRSGFTVDYPSPVALLQSLLTSTSGDNVGHYSNKQFDQLVADAAATRSDTTRAQLVKNAEKLAIGDDQALIPLWYRSQYRVFDSSKFTGVRLDKATETLVLSEISAR